MTGFLVSGVTEIHRVSWADITPPMGYLADVVIGSIVGIVTIEDHFLQLLDLESILAQLDPESFAKPIEHTDHGGERYTALVADDSQTIRHMLNKILTEANFDLTIVTNGKQALDTLFKFKDQAEAQGRDIRKLLDVVISDIEMPLMDGFSLTKNIRQDPVLRTLPIILYSSLITKELMHKGESVGADDQVSKPDIDQMADRAIRLIESRRGGVA